MRSDGMSRVRAVVNLPLLLFVAALTVYGTVMVRSATSGMLGGDGMIKRHILGLVIGLVPMLVAWVIDYQKLAGWIGPLSLANAFLILSPNIPGLGDSSHGATQWLQIAGVRLFQPSEPAKLLTILIMAAVISSYKGRIERWADVGRIFAYLALPLGLIMLQDLGTALVFVAITAGMLLVGGLKARTFAAVGLIGLLLVAAILGIGSGVNRALHRGPYDPAYIAAVGSGSPDAIDNVRDTSVLLKRYQVNRLLVFIDPKLDPRGAGYNLAQSKIAIGSGGVTGKGLGAGTQGNLHFLPERHTDFIFSVIGEELGFLGALLLLGLYFGLLLTSLEVSASSRDLFGTLIAAGLISMWAFQILENVGMTVGIMPITGIPLPFMSFGSSFMVTNLAGTGMLLSVWARRIGT